MTTAELIFPLRDQELPMCAQIIALELAPGQVEQAVAFYRESVIPAAREMKGFNGALLLTAATGTSGYAISLWESEADLQDGERSRRMREQAARFGSLVAAMPMIEVMHVSVQE